MVDMAQILDMLGMELAQAFAVFLRLTAFFALMPAMGEQSVPNRVKLGLALAMTVFVAPIVTVPVTEVPIYRLIFTEILSGLLLGLTLRLFVMALQTAGVIAAQATSLSQLLGGSAVDPMPALGHILVISGLAFFTILGLHVKAIEYLVISYDFLPAGFMPDAALSGEWGTHRVAQSFALAFSLAAPFVILSVIYNLALGAINRAMPQLMVAFVGAPLITGGALALLCLSAPLILTAWAEAFSAFLENPSEMQ